MRGLIGSRHRTLTTRYLDRYAKSAAAPGIYTVGGVCENKDACLAANAHTACRSFMATAPFAPRVLQ
eukprot:1552869-Prymnesium_polylepis.1